MCTQKEAASLLGVSLKKIKALILKGELNACDIRLACDPKKFRFIGVTKRSVTNYKKRHQVACI